MNRDQLHILIERYFNAETTIEEERRLAEELLALPPGDPEADETLAVMGYARRPATTAKPTPAKKRSGRKPLRRIIAGAAAAAALAIAASAVFTESGDPKPTSGECIAYVNGRRIDDEKAVMNIVAAQLGEMGDVADDISMQMENDFSDIREAMKSE